MCAAAAADYILVDVYVAGAALDDKGLGAQRSQGVDECGVFYGSVVLMCLCFAHYLCSSLSLRLSLSPNDLGSDP